MCIVPPSHDKKLYKYSIPPVSAGSDPSTLDLALENCLKQPPKPAFFDKHSSAVLHIDFSSDEKYFQTNCQAGELLFGEIQTLKQEPSASKLADYNNSAFGDDEEVTGTWVSQVGKLVKSLSTRRGTFVSLTVLFS